MLGIVLAAYKYINLFNPYKHAMRYIQLSHFLMSKLRHGKQKHPKYLSRPFTEDDIKANGQMKDPQHQWSSGRCNLK